MPASPAAEDYHQRMMEIVAEKHKQEYAYPLNPVPPGMRQKIRMNRSTHVLAYEDESEGGVTFVIEPKEQD